MPCETVRPKRVRAENSASTWIGLSSPLMRAKRSKSACVSERRSRMTSPVAITAVQPEGDHVEGRFGHRLQRHVALPEAVAAAEHHGETHEGPRPHLGIARPELPPRLAGQKGSTIV